MSRQQGRLVKWDDERGFGFIAPDGSREQIFVHIKSIGEIATRPQPGDRVSFEVGPGRDGRPAATNVVIAGANPRDRVAERRGLPEPTRAAVSFRVAGAVIILGLAIANVLMETAPVWLLAVYGIVGLASFWLYYSDKQSAQSSQWRTAEATLHGLDMAGGIGVGLLAQHIFRHKTAKPEFVAVTAVIAALHVALNAALLLGFVAWPI